jgi:DNA-binding CsgD family transcriptional regulator
MIEDARLMALYIDGLTSRQRDVLRLVVNRGLTNGEIAQCLNITAGVVADHLTNIYDELGKLEAFGDKRPNRYVLIRTFTPFFMRHPELRGPRSDIHAESKAGR